GLDHKEIALKLLEAGSGDAVAYNLEKFQGLDHKEIALKLLEAGSGDAVAYNLEKFGGIKMVEETFDQFEKFLIYFESDLKIEEQIVHKEKEYPNLQGFLEKKKSWGVRSWGKLIDYLKAQSKEQRMEKIDWEKISPVLQSKMSGYLDGQETAKILDGGLKEELEKVTVNYKETENLHSLLKEREIWSEETVKWFGDLEKVLGSRVSWEYLRDYNRHDALFFIHGAVAKLSKDILQKILTQVPYDTTVDWHGRDAYQVLGQVIQNYQPYWAEEFQKENRFASFRAFVKGVELRRALSVEDKNQLEALKEENPVLASYLESLFSHPTVSTEAVKEYWQNPKEFLNRSDQHAPEELHQALTPARYLEIGEERDRIGIDLLPQELRDALPKGILDRLCPFLAYRQEFEVNLTDEVTRRKMREQEGKQEAIKTNLLEFLAHETESREKSQDKTFASLLNQFLILSFLKEPLLKYFEENKEQIKARALKGKEEPQSQIERLLALQDYESGDEARIHFTQNRTKENFENYKLEKLLNFFAEQKIHYNLGYLASRFKELPIPETKFKVGDFSGLSLKEVFKRIQSEPDLRKIINPGNEVFSSFSSYLQTEVYGKAFKADKVTLTAEILQKSHPAAATVGDDTVCCMPWGSGKHNEYLWNPNCGIMSISLESPDPETGEIKKRVIAQSILTQDWRYEPKELAALYSQAEKGKVSLTEIFGPDFLERFFKENQIPVIACDNVEGQKNFIKRLIVNNETIISRIYKEFFEAYKKTNPKFENSPVVIGTGYSDYLTGLPTAENRYLPASLVSYTDKKADEVFSLFLESKPEKLPEPKTGVEEIDFSLTLPVAYIEEKTYGATGHFEGLPEIQNLLCASSIACEKEKITPLNLGWFDKKGVLRGYLLAYPAEKEREKVVYVHDIAVLPEWQKKGVGMELIQKAVERINDDPKLLKLPIETRMRAGSYAIIQKYAERLGFKITADEKVEEMGEEIHYVRLERKE
ncbi:MAG: N-acetyltransferase protein, partial [Candidatus Magasanikbacteria bacterium]|nr:N-acetyltransferase protein [Candidatus Magasanikbacteria bacterium]